MLDLLEKNINTKEYWNRFYANYFGEGDNLERNTFWLQWIPTHLEVRLLEIGYGSDKGMVKNLVNVRPNVKMTALDFSSSLIERDKVLYFWVDFICADVLDYFPEQKFDIILCQHVLEHFDDPQIFVDKISNNFMVVGGLFLLSLPHWGSFRSPEHVKAYTPGDILDLVSNDFHILNVSIIDCKEEGQEMRFILAKKRKK